MNRKYPYLFYVFFLFLPVLFCAVFMTGINQVRAQEMVPDEQTTVKAQVLEIIKNETKEIPGTDTQGNFQTIRVKILEGKEEGKEVTVENDYLNLDKGEVFYLMHTSNSADGSDYYSVSEPYRLPHMVILIGIFVVGVFLLGGIQGIRGLVSLIGSFLIILYVLLPGILHGYSPLSLTILVSSLIIIIGSYITHGFNKTTTSAVVGMVVTVLFTGLLAYWSVGFTKLSGFGSEDVVYLNLNARGTIDVVGLLLGGIMIGLLGVLYDVAIGQAISVEELMRIAPHVHKRVIYKRAIRIGREHIGALVNTLAIAYVGASLPLLLIFYQSSSASMANLINKEIFATEIVRTLIGSIGLILAVPITTFISVWLLSKKKKGQMYEDVSNTTLIEKEKQALEHAGHSHV